MPDERRLRELAAIAQIYGQLQGPQQQQQNEQQRTALAVLGLMLQQQQQLGQQGYQQQELQQRQQQLGQQQTAEANRQGEWQGQHQLAQQQLTGQESARSAEQQHQSAMEQHAMEQLGLQRQTLEATQSAQKEAAAGRDRETMAMLLQHYGTLMPDQQKALAPLLGQLFPEFGKAQANVATQQRTADMPGATAAYQKIAATPEKARGAAWTTEAARHPALSYLDFSNPALYPQGAPATAAPDIAPQPEMQGPPLPSNNPFSPNGPSLWDLISPSGERLKAREAAREKVRQELKQRKPPFTAGLY